MSYFNNLSFRQQFVGLAFLSGFLYLLLFYAVEDLNEEVITMFLGVLGIGLIYGLLTLKALKTKYFAQNTKYIWITLSLFSYATFIAIAIALGHSGISRPDPTFISLSLAGLLGALILAIGFRMVIKQNEETISLVKIILISLIGGITSIIIILLAHYVTYYSGYYFSYDFILFSLVYTLWPAIISFILASNIKKIG